MGKRLDALLGRKFKTHKFKPLVSLAFSRLAVLKNQRQIKCSQARSDVLLLLQEGHHERALLRVEQVIKEQNMLDAFLMMESYCNLLIERIHLIEQEKVCPEELKEAISSLLYAASRCGEFPELQEIRALFTSRYGKDFVGRAIELRNNCGVNLKMIQKLSTRQPLLENRMNVLKQIASENSIVLQLEEASSTMSTEESLDLSKKQNQADLVTSPTSSQPRKKYKDVADAAQAAFESAAYAAAAAQAAVELSRPESHHPDDHDSPSAQRKSKDITGGSQDAESNSKNAAAEPEKEMSISSSSSDSNDEDPTVVITASFDDDDELDDPVKLLDKDIVFDESSDNEDIDSGFPREQKPSSSRASLKSEKKVDPSAHAAEGSRLQSKQRLDMARGPPISVRTRQVRGY